MQFECLIRFEYILTCIHACMHEDNPRHNEVMSPVLNIGRVGRDIVRYLLFFCCLYDMGKSFVILFAAKNGRYLKYRPINGPISPDMK